MKQRRTCRTSLHHICVRETKCRMVVWGKFGENYVELRACCSNHSEVHLGGVHLYSEVDEADGLEVLAGSDASDCSELQDELLKDVKSTRGHISTRDAWQLEYDDKVSSNHCEEAKTSDHLNLLLRLDLNIIIEQGKTLKAAQEAYNEVRAVVVFAMGTLLNVGFDMQRDGGEDEYDDEKVMTQIIIDKILLNVVSSGSPQYCLGHDKHLLTDKKMNMSLFLYLELEDIQWAPFLLAMRRPSELDMEKDSIGKEHKSRKRIDMDSETWSGQILHLLWLFWVEGRLKREDQIVALLLALLCFFVLPVGMLFELVQHGAVYSLLHFNGFLVEHSPLHVGNAVLASPMDLGKYSCGDQNNTGIQLNEAKSTFGEGSNLQLLPDCSFNSLEQTLGTRFLEGGSNVTGILFEGSFCKCYRDLNGNV